MAAITIRKIKMRSLLFVILFTCLCFGADTTGTWNASTGQNDMNSVANYSWSPASPSAIDSFSLLVFNNTSVVNATATASFICKTLTINSNYTGAWNDAGKTITILSTVAITPGSGGFTASGTWTQTGDANFTLSNSSKYYITGMNIVLDGTGTFSTTQGPNAQTGAGFFNNLSCSFPGKTTTVVSNNGNPLDVIGGELILNGGTFAINCYFGFSIVNQATPIVMTAPTIILGDGTHNLQMRIYNNSDFIFSLPAMAFPSTTSLAPQKVSGGSGTGKTTINESGNMAWGFNGFKIVHTTGGANVLNTNGYTNTWSSGTIQGSSVDAAHAIVNCSYSNIGPTPTISMDGTNKYITLNMQSSQWVDTGSCTLTSYMTINDSVSRFVMCPVGGNKTVTSAGKAFGIFVDSAAAVSYRLSLADSMRDSLDLDVYGKMDFAGKSVYIMRDLCISSAPTDTVWRSGNNFIGRDFSYSGTSTILNDTATYFRHLGSSTTHQITSGGKKLKRINLQDRYPFNFLDNLNIAKLSTDSTASVTFNGSANFDTLVEHDSSTYTFQAGTIDSIKNHTKAGSAGKLVTYTSNSAITLYTPANDTVSYHRFTNAHAVNTIYAMNGTNVDGGGNTNIVFPPPQYTLTVTNSNPAGTITPTAGGHTYDSAAAQAISYTPPAGYRKLIWIGGSGVHFNGDSTSVYLTSTGTLTVTIAANDTIPIITAITPAYGKAAGGRKSYITHQHHLDSIYYGSTIGTISGDTATAPAHTMVHQADTVDVIVANSAGRDTLVKGFVYANIWGLVLSPSHGDTAGGTAIAWTAYYGLQGGGASLGGVAVTGVVIADSAHGSGVAPKHAAGVVDFRAWNAAHDTATVSGAYQYTAGSTGRRHRGGFGLWLGL
jgi:hypothetical protein